LTRFQSNSSLHGTPPGFVGRMNTIVTIATSTTAIGFIHRYFLPSVQGPGWNASPIRQRK
jgi:hypothetical protein